VRRQQRSRIDLDLDEQRDLRDAVETYPACAKLGGSVLRPAGFDHGEEAVGCGLLGTTGISGGEPGGTPTGSKGGGTFGAGEGTPRGSGDGASPGKGGRAGAGLGSAGVGSG